MVFKIMNESTNTNDIGGENHIYVENGKFYWYTPNGYEPVPSSMLGPIKAQYREWDKIERLKKENPNFDQDEYDRIKQELANETESSFKGGINNGGINKKRDLSKKPSEKFKAETGKHQRQWKGIKINPSVKDVFTDMEQDFQSNILDNDDDEMIMKSNYQTYNPNKLGNILRPSSNLKLNLDEPEEEKEKPFIFFYFDRSSSFNPKNGQEAKLKTEMGNKIRDGFLSLMGQGEVVAKTLYFCSEGDGGYDANGNYIPGKCVFEDEQKALSIGGNDGDGLIKDIRERTKGHLSNVVIVTDDDNHSATETVEVDGGVWLIFFNQRDNSLHNKVVGTKVNKEYFFHLGGDSQVDPDDI